MGLEYRKKRWQIKKNRNIGRNRKRIPEMQSVTLTCRFVTLWKKRRNCVVSFVL